MTVPVASLQPIGAYDGLEWANFDVVNIGNGVTGVKPESSPNVALLYIASGGVSPTATLEPTGNTNYFALSSFYFGCVLSTEETLASAPTSCTISVTGMRNGKTVATESFSYTPDNAVLADLEKVTFNGQWAVVDHVVFQSTGTLAAAQSVIFDNFVYTTVST